MEVDTARSFFAPAGRGSKPFILTARRFAAVAERRQAKSRFEQPREVEFAADSAFLFVRSKKGLQFNRNFLVVQILNF